MTHALLVPLFVLLGVATPAEWEEMTTRDPEPVESVWDVLAACESSGEWDYNPSTATWGNRLFEGGLQFHPDTWDAFRPASFPEAAYLATKHQQVHVGELVLEAQGWNAWPTCSRKLGLTR